MKILTIIGARPQFVKASVISRQITATVDQYGIQEEIIHTGQHYDKSMSGDFFSELGIPDPKVNLNINGGSHGQMTGRMLEQLELQMLERKPDIVLVYGDTNSTLAGALASAKLNIPLAHVESGLRSYNKSMPEEINRITTDHVAELLFCPTQLSVQNLGKENITDGVHWVGDVMYDAFLYKMASIEKTEKRELLLKNALAEKEFVLVTCHRAENTSNRRKLENIFSALNSLANNIPIVMPLHPRTRKSVDEFGLNHLLSNIKVLTPLSYGEMLVFLEAAKLVITDSGGLQKEALFAKTKCLTLRDETEWPETLQNGNNQLIDVDNHAISDTVSKALHGKFNTPGLPYGKGNSGEAIVNILYQYNQ